MTPLLLLLLAVEGNLDRCEAVALDAEQAAIVWRMDAVYDVRLQGDAAIVERQTELRKVDARTGDTRWTYPFDEEMIVPELAVLPDRVALVQEGRYIAFLDGRSGERIARLDAGEDLNVRKLVGPPLLAVMDKTDEEISTLVRLTGDGTILGKRTVPRVEDIRMVQDVAVVEYERGVPDPELDTLTGYDSATLQPLWSEKSFTFNKQVIGDALYLGDIFWSKGAKAIDPKTGAVKALVPIRDPFKVGGSREFDLQVVTTKWSGAWDPHFATCEGLRRNNAKTAKTMWQIDLPFHVSATLRDGARLYVAGSRDADHRYLLALDWKTGAIQCAWSGVPEMTELLRVDDLLLGYDLAGDLVAIRLPN